jgi:lipoprotein-anchoring transpeptidase ErfK/SrfK
MRRIQSSREARKAQSGRWGLLAAVIFLLSADALAQEQASKPKSEATEKSAPRRIVVSIPDRKLALIESGRVVKTWRVAVGAPGTPSPAGEFRVANRIERPTYYAPGKVIGPGPANPLGTRWIGLSLRGYGIHGTNEPDSIGRRASHGCIRLRNADVEELFEMVRPGDIVELHRTRTAEVALLFAEPALPVPAPEKVATPVLVAAAVGR